MQCDHVSVIGYEEFDPIHERCTRETEPGSLRCATHQIAALEPFMIYCAEIVPKSKPGEFLVNWREVLAVAESCGFFTLHGTNRCLPSNARWRRTRGAAIKAAIASLCERSDHLQKEIAALRERIDWARGQLGQVATPKASVCLRCGGTGRIQGCPATIFETDTAEERDLAWERSMQPCPECKQK